jgi:NAD(P)-dependent dehydrogenase (short-subunit alcohol dehydrogenase family)
MRVSSPTVILIPGVGMVNWGKTKSESRVVAEFYKAAIGVMRGAEAVSSYTALPRQEAFDIEYWLLEEAKLKRMPAEKELSRRVVAVFGAGSGIGEALTARLLDEGATVVALDLKEDAAKQTAAVQLDRLGMGIGVAGTGTSGGGDILGLRCDVTVRSSIRKALDEAVFAYGGLDSVVVTAGYYTSTAPNAGANGAGDAAWATSFAVNAVGPYLVADEAATIWDKQDLSGSLVLTTSVNGVVAKQGSFAYDTSKAAANHLVRELAIRFAPRIRVNAVAPATVIEGSSMFPRERVIESLKKYGQDHDDGDSTEILRDRLARFYADRTLTKQPIRLVDQTEALFLLVSDRFSRTTGQVINVDGGLVEAFQR